MHTRNSKLERLKNRINEIEFKEVELKEFYKENHPIYVTLSQQKKLVFLRPLDMEIISGGCHFNEKCKKYINNCNNCPKIYLSKFHNIASNNLLKKKEIFNNYESYH